MASGHTWLRIYGFKCKIQIVAEFMGADIGHKYILEQGSTKIGLYIYGLEISNLYPWA